MREEMREKSCFVLNPPRLGHQSVASRKRTKFFIDSSVSSRQHRPFDVKVTRQILNLVLWDSEETNNLHLTYSLVNHYIGTAFDYFPTITSRDQGTDTRRKLLRNTNRI